MEAVRRFIQMHGSARFEVTNEDATAERVRIVNRAGFRRETARGTEYLIFSEVWKDEVVAGLDPRAAARSLARRGFLVTKDGRLQNQVRLPGLSSPMWVYHVLPEILSDPGP